MYQLYQTRILAIFSTPQFLVAAAVAPATLVEADSSFLIFFFSMNEQRPKQPKQTWYHMQFGTQIHPKP